MTTAVGLRRELTVTPAHVRSAALLPRRPSRCGEHVHTVADLIEAWLAHSEGRLEGATMLGYRSAARQLVPSLRLTGGSITGGMPDLSGCG